ncbi:uncharacterized protein JN550_013556 [Neoarthrinium moseri]|uniref:uncharacterized protein n=1 Tax=Neoarthrinium moseri TaxID=1658444 RepID=UPI001FDB4190|nr:uncharacterized protein JN550_013556 [Neoarthrinium moseri]KAI1856954.1 hypothetical protein JN550_013556 [Neoarthrinium moseri]
MLVTSASDEMQDSKEIHVGVLEHNVGRFLVVVQPEEACYIDVMDVDEAPKITDRHLRYVFHFDDPTAVPERFADPCIRG